jgi:hypothetical protein
MREVRLILVLAALAAFAAADTVDVSLHGRRVQVDGFLLEWNGDNARAWADAWRWDALVTPDGVAGYISSRGAPECGEWAFGVKPENGREIAIRAPDGNTSENAAFDRDGFEREGIYNIEWLVPNDAVSGAPVYSAVITLTGANACGGALPPVVIRVVGEAQSKRPVAAAAVTMAAAAALTVIIAAVRRKRRRVSNPAPARAKK